MNCRKHLKIVVGTGRFFFFENIFLLMNPTGSAPDVQLEDFDRTTFFAAETIPISDMSFSAQNGNKHITDDLFVRSAHRPMPIRFLRTTIFNPAASF